ncbi:MAG: hypothetical protein Q8J88_01080 [Bacteroidales bacterium]|nr:hypothetical protein [Bacteroidales bacterium]
MRKYSVDKEIKALSWCQPYADLMMAGKIETRIWKTNYRGWVLICSSKKPYNIEQIRDISGHEGLLRIADLIHKTERFTQKTASAIAIGYLSDCRKMTPEDEEACYVSYHPRLYCHVYEDVQMLPQPLPWKGKLGWGNVKDELKAEIVKMLEL